jgi:hypothetical protein
MWKNLYQQIYQLIFGLVGFGSGATQEGDGSRHLGVGALEILIQKGQLFQRLKKSV